MELLEILNMSVFTIRIWHFLFVLIFVICIFAGDRIVDEIKYIKYKKWRKENMIEVLDRAENEMYVNKKYFSDEDIKRNGMVIKE